MSIVDARPITDLATSVTGIKATIPVLTTLGQIFHPIPIPIPIPIRLPKPPVQTPVLRGGTAIGYIVTPGGDPAPTAPNVGLQNGVLWLEPSQFGTPFAAVTGWVGIPFTGATLTVSGGIANFAGAQITLDATATLTLQVTSSVEPVTAPAGDPIGVDFTNSKLVPFAQATFALTPGGASIAVAGAASATVYGQTVSVSPQAGAAPVLLTVGLQYVALPASVAPQTFAVASSASLELELAGSAPLLEAAVLFPIVAATPGSFPAATDAWGLSLALGAGLRARFATLTAPVPLSGAVVALTGTQLFGFLVVGETSATDRYTLWVTPAPPSPLPPTQPQLTFPPAQVTIAVNAGTLVGFSLEPAQETIEELGALAALLDRPIAADGSRIAIGGLALAVRARTATKITLEIASALTPNPAASLALIAQNALVPVGAPNGFVLNGTVRNNAVSGTLEVTFPGSVVLPTLPDPYAALYTAAAAQNLAGVGANVSWTGGRTAGPQAQYLPRGDAGGRLAARRRRG